MKILKKFKPIKLKKNQTAIVDWIFSFTPDTMEMIKVERKVKIKKSTKKRKSKGDKK